MIFIWGEGKNYSNLLKHGVNSELASLVFHDPELVSIPDKRFQYVEEPLQSIGRVDDVALYLVHLVEENIYGEEKIRIISARKATTGEARRYYFERHP